MFPNKRQMSVLREKKREEKKEKKEKKDEGDGSEEIEERKVKIKKRLNRVAVCLYSMIFDDKEYLMRNGLACNKGHHYTHRKRHTGAWKVNIQSNE